MPRAFASRADFSTAELRHLARRSGEAAQAYRLLALAAVCNGGTRSEAARLCDVTLQIVRGWVMRFNAEGPEGLRDRKAAGPTPLLTDAHRQALAAQIDRGRSLPATAWCAGALCDPGQWLWEEFRIPVSMQTLSRELRAIGYRKLSARPKHHAQVDGGIETFKKPASPKTFSPSADGLIHFGRCGRDRPDGRSTRVLRHVGPAAGVVCQGR